MDNTIYIVTYWNNNSTMEPVVTAFNNYENAKKCYDYYIQKHDCCLDKVPVFTHFNF